MNSARTKEVSSLSRFFSNAPVTVIDDENETKPVLSNIIPTRKSDEVQSHSFHDFSIHIEKRKKYLITETPCVSVNSRSDAASRSQLKCSDSFSAKTCCGFKRWTAEDVCKVISIERVFFRTSTFIIRLPDKKVNKQIVARTHPSIRAVHFLHSPYARRCCVTLKDPKERTEVLTKLNSTQFGSGYLSADDNFEELIPSIDDVDPFTLFLDNIQPHVNKKDLMDMFPNSQQIIVGYKNKIYYTKRYAFIVYLLVKDAIETFKKVNNQSEVLVRFRRFSGSAHLPVEPEILNCQGSVDNSQVGLPIVSDPGPPVFSIERNYKVVQNITIKSELAKNNSEIVLDDDDCDINAETAIDSPDIDFEQLYERLKRSRMELSLLGQME